MKWVLLASAFVTVSVVGAAQQRRDAALGATGTAQIAGTVVTGDSAPVPVRRAIVTLTGEGRTRLAAVTDDAGAFAFTGLPADRYSLFVAKNGYVPMNYGSKRPGAGGTPIVVADGQRATVAMTLPRGSVITGSVRDERGSPVPDVSVTAMRYAVSFATGERTLQSVNVGSSGLVVPGYSVDAFPGTGTTDDRGIYRIYGLPAGEYVISAAVRPRGLGPLASTDLTQVTAADVQRAERLLRQSSSRTATDAAVGAPARVAASRVDYAPVYHPAAVAAADAATITLGVSEEKPGVDVLLRLVPTATIAGVVTAPDGTPVSNAQVSIMDPASSSGRVMRATRSSADGAFAIAGIAPGHYELQSSSYAEGLFGSSELEVHGRDLSTSMVMRPGGTVSGRVLFDGASPAPGFNSVMLLLARHTFATGGPRFQMHPDGRFVFSSVPPGRYRLRINGPPPAGWILRSVMANGIDASDIAFDVTGTANVQDVAITLTDRPAEISGVLQNAAGEPAPEYALVRVFGRRALPCGGDAAHPACAAGHHRPIHRRRPARGRLSDQRRHRHRGQSVERSCVSRRTGGELADQGHGGRRRPEDPEHPDWRALTPRRCRKTHRCCRPSGSDARPCRLP